MEVLTSHRNKRTILLIKENSEDAAQLCKMLADSYNFMVVTELEESISTFRRICDCLSAVLIMPVKCFCKESKNIKNWKAFRCW